jgi:hypothetical protein
MILSASRRTDIPAYFSDWFINRLNAGYALTRNPINHSQVSKVLLEPGKIDCIVFWTKDPTNMMDKLKILDDMGYHYYFQFTLTPYDKEIEKNLRVKEKIIDTFQILSRQIGKDKVLWRYDPILLNDEITVSYHRDKFEDLCNKLQGYTNSCTISFVDVYTKLNRSVKNKVIREITTSEMEQLAFDFSSIGKKYQIEIKACSEKMDLQPFGIKPAACIDKELVERVCGYPITVKNDPNQRPGCGCVQSVDIGVYNTCRNGCIYCYANHSEASIKQNCANHDPTSELLIGSVGVEEIIKVRN